MSSGRLRAGLIGAGRIVREGHLPAYRANSDLVEIVALADPDEHNAAVARAALQLPPDRWHRDPRELLHRSDLDLVVVASPPNAHRQAIVDALARRTAVVCEKPLCLDQAELAAVRAAAGSNGFVAVLHNYLYKPGWRHLIGLVRQGRIGRATMVRFEELSHDHWRSPDAPRDSWRQHAEHGGGPLRDNLYHTFYLAEQILGSSLWRAFGEQATLVHPYPAGDIAVSVARHHNGALSQGIAMWCHRGAARATVEVHGTEASLRYRYWGEPDRLYLDRGDQTQQLPIPDWAPELESGYQDAFREILRRLQRGDPPPQGLGDAARVMEALAQLADGTAKGER